MYILDTNFFIDANKFHLPIEQNADFWGWIVSLAEDSTISIPQAVCEELLKGNDDLAKWVDEHKEKLVDPTKSFAQIREVMENGYGSIDEVITERLKADPWVIAHALEVSGKVVTGEKPGNQTAPHNKKIPSVCQALGVPYLTITGFMWEVRAMMPM